MAGKDSAVARHEAVQISSLDCWSKRNPSKKGNRREIELRLLENK